MKGSGSVDQAEGLRQLSHPKNVQVIAVTGGKGGVGKTNISVNLSIALARRRRRVMLFDADLGLANVDVVLGLHSPYNLSHVIDERCRLEDILIEGPEGVLIVPAGSGAQKMAQLNAAQHAALIREFSGLSCPLDTLIIDTAAGISDSVISFTRAAQEALIVVCNEPTSITDAYGLMKFLSRDYQVKRFRVLANMVSDAEEGLKLFSKLTLVTDRFLDVTLQYVGSVPHDTMVRKAVQKQTALLDAFPSAPAARAIDKLADQVTNWSPSTYASGQLSFFVERMISAQQSAFGQKEALV